MKFNKGELIVIYQFIHTAVMTSLRPECYYEYQIFTEYATSDTYMFSGRTPDYSEPYQDALNPITLCIIGDWGTGPDGVAVGRLFEQHVKIWDFLAVIHLGDIAYNLDQEDGQTGDIFFNQIEPVAAKFPYMSLPGNHEK